MTLELKNVVKEQDAQVHIHSTSLTLKPGVFNILLGPTLSGKTTLMRLMAGLEKPTAGEIWFNGKNVTGVAVQKRNVAMVYQQFINYPNMTVFNNIASPLRLEKQNKEQIRSRVKEVSELLGLTPMLERMPNALSGGQQQRIALARALVKNADLVLLDEPLANLDYKLREELREQLPKLFSDSGATVVYATTEPTEALLLGGYTATLHEGRITQYGPTHQVYRQPGNLLSAVEFSDPPLNMLAVSKRGNEFTDNSNRLPMGKRFSSAPDGEYTLAFRPHHLELAPEGTGNPGFSGTVKLTEINGSETLLHLQVDQYRWVSQLHGIHRFEEGQSINMQVTPAHCFLFNQDGQPVEAT